MFSPSIIASVFLLLMDVRFIMEWPNDTAEIVILEKRGTFMGYEKFVS
jgi:hypothetical protein